MGLEVEGNDRKNEYDKGHALFFIICVLFEECTGGYRGVSKVSNAGERERGREKEWDQPVSGASGVKEKERGKGTL